MDIKQLRYFVTVVNLRSFSDAGKNLYVSQSTLSKSVQALEEELQVKLIYFTGKKMHLTSYGTELYNMAQNLLMQFDAIAPTINDIRHLQRGLLRIGLPPMIGTYVFPELIAGFISQNPGIELVIKQDMARVVQQQVSSNLLDFGFTISPIPEDVNSTLIIESHYVAVINTSNPLSQKELIDYIDLKNEKLILLDSSYKFHDEILVNCRRSDFIPNIIMQLENFDLALRLVEQNVGITILPLPIVNLSATRNCVFLPINDPNFIYEIIMISPKNEYKTIASRAFQEYVEQRIGESDLFRE